eukprot:TRINITY_DN7437_c1_g1_i1.p1 TRINITY_DN7437_c1_g1~~TRINITY_DN7437_c1_g1_i1.p1  ORF type:complete len:598 (+),score=184.32 TRINITY_DN7437_c1_g1_i1:87-1880(+)
MGAKSRDSEGADGKLDAPSAPSVGKKSRRTAFGSGKVEDDSVAEKYNFPKKHRQLFVDANDMKAKLREKIDKPVYDVSQYYWPKTEGATQEDIDAKRHVDSKCRDIATNPIFENTTLFVISLNALWLAIDTDNNKADTLANADAIFIVVENFFCFYFTFEWAVRFGAFKWKPDGLRDAWFVFDSILVMFMVGETWIMFIYMKAAGGGESLGNTSLLKLLKLLRLSRMARMARLLRSMPELLILIKGMVAAVRSVFFTLLLLVLLVYVFGIYFRQMTRGFKVGELYFDSISGSMHALLTYGVFCDSVTGIVADFEAETNAYHLLLPYYLFMLLGSFTVMNMLIGVLCEVVSAVASTEQEELTIGYMKEKLLDIIVQYEKDEWKKAAEAGRKVKEVPLDTTQDKEKFMAVYQIHQDKFMKLLELEATAQLLTEVEVDAVGLVDIVDTLFKEADGSPKILSFGDLVSVMLDQRSTNTATVKDLTNIRKFIRGRLEALEEQSEDIQGSLEADSARRSAQFRVLGGFLEQKVGEPAGTFETRRQERFNELKKKEEEARKRRADALAAEIDKAKKEMEKKMQEKREAVQAKGAQKPAPAMATE